jgi:hypothetical protein
MKHITGPGGVHDIHREARDVHDLPAVAEGRAALA